MNNWLKSHLVCPRDKQQLDLQNEKLICPDGHIYPIFSDIPIMLVDEAEATHGYIEKTLEKVAQTSGTDEKQIDEISEREIDSFVQNEIPYTSGNLYFSVQNNLKRYPIPETRLWKGKGERLLDIGCNWGRWSIAAARKGFLPIGLDPSLEAVLAARRVAKQLKVEADFVVGDARFLPFADDSFEVVFFLQRLSAFEQGKCENFA